MNRSICPFCPTITHSRETKPLSDPFLASEKSEIKNLFFRDLIKPNAKEFEDR
jgi:hypothetical protein